MTWTTEKPTAPGWYWWRESKKSSRRAFVRVAKNEHGEPCYYFDGDSRQYVEIYGQTAGPIPEPKE